MVCTQLVANRALILLAAPAVVFIPLLSLTGDSLMLVLDRQLVFMSCGVCRWCLSSVDLLVNGLVVCNHFDTFDVRSRKLWLALVQNLVSSRSSPLVPRDDCHVCQLCLRLFGGAEPLKPLSMSSPLPSLHSSSVNAKRFDIKVFTQTNHSLNGGPHHSRDNRVMGSVR